MCSEHTVLLLGATGRTGGRVLEQLLRRGVSARAVVRPFTLETSPRCIACLARA